MTDDTVDVLPNSMKQNAKVIKRELDEATGEVCVTVIRNPEIVSEKN